MKAGLLELSQTTKQVLLAIDSLVSTVKTLPSQTRMSRFTISLHLTNKISTDSTNIQSTKKFQFKAKN